MDQGSGKRAGIGLLVLVVAAASAFVAYHYVSDGVRAEMERQEAMEGVKRERFQGVRDQIQKAADHTLPKQDVFDEIKR